MIGEMVTQNEILISSRIDLLKQFASRNNFCLVEIHLYQGLWVVFLKLEIIKNELTSSQVSFSSSIKILISSGMAREG